MISFWRLHLGPKKDQKTHKMGHVLQYSPVSLYNISVNIDDMYMHVILPNVSTCWGQKYFQIGTGLCLASNLAPWLQIHTLEVSIHMQHSIHILLFMYQQFVLTSNKMNTRNVCVWAMVNMVLSFDSIKLQTLQFSILRDSLEVQAYALAFLSDLFMQRGAQHELPSSRVQHVDLLPCGGKNHV